MKFGIPLYLILGVTARWPWLRFADIREMARQLG